MATIKSYTDLEQSKKLAKILSLESADMRYGYIAPYDYSDRMYDGGYDEIPYQKDFLIKNPNFSANEYDAELPCWSLAALLDAIPKEVKIKGQRYAPCLFPIIDGHWLYKLWYNSNKIIESPIAVWCDNLVDACVEMILKLNEENLL